MIPIIKLLKGDITKLKVDAIVNAANSKLAGGGGVDGAIHIAAGDKLTKACMELGGCNTGNAKITPGFNLYAKYIIHTVGPVWRGGDSKEKELLESCYIESLKIAVENNINTIAFPNISTGIYGFPKKDAAEISVGTVKRFIENSKTLKQIIFVCFDDENYSLYKKLLG